MFENNHEIVGITNCEIMICKDPLYLLPKMVQPSIVFIHCFEKSIWNVIFLLPMNFFYLFPPYLDCKIQYTFLTSSISSYQTITRKIDRWVWITFTACVVTVFSLLNIVIQNTGWTAFSKVKLAFCNVGLLVAETISKQWICDQV